MKEEMKKKINETLKIKARELAAEEGRGYIEAEWLQTQDIGLNINIKKYIEDAVGKGYRSEDISVRTYISTHREWYTWLAYKVEHPLLGSMNSDRIEFPGRNNHAKAFVMPLFEKEVAEKKEREKIKLEESLLRQKISSTIDMKLREIVEDGEFELDDVTYTIETQGID